jgi:hypothetical protein
MTAACSYTLRSEDRKYDWLVTLLTLQGVANHDAPRVFFDTRDLADWHRADRVRRALNGKDYGIRCRLLRTRSSLLQHMRSRIKGAVLYDPKLDATRWLAVTLAGLEDLLPLTPAQRKDVPWPIEVRHDLRRRWSNGPDAYAWAIRNLLPRCDRTVAYNAGHSHDRIDLGSDPGVILALDYAVSRRGFVFNLSPAAGPDKYFNRKVPGYPEDVRVFRKILSRLKAPAAVYGWAEPEWTMTTLLNRHDHYLMCGREPNLSFHAAIPVPRNARRLRQHPPASIPRLEKKCYLAFMTSEGDTPRVSSSFFMGGWHGRDRGRIPVNWGMSPLEAELMPAHVAHFYRTATANDYFYSGTGGAGYVFVNRLKHPDIYIRHAAPHLRRADMNVVEIWHNGRIPYATYEAYARKCGLAGIVHLPQGPAHTRSLDGGVPLVFMDASVLHFYGTPTETADRIRAIADTQSLPIFLPVYRSPRPDVATQFLRIARKLDPNRFEPVRLDVMMRLARRALRRTR